MLCGITKPGVMNASNSEAPRTEWEWGAVQPRLAVLEYQSPKGAHCAPSGPVCDEGVCACV